MARTIRASRVRADMFFSYSGLLPPFARVMIQTLLLMLKISLPPLETLNPEKTIKKKNKAKEQTTPETTETRLESYMDKLAVWQLTGTLGTSQLSSQSVNPSRLSRKEELHWTQVFYEDVVAPL